MIEIKGKGGITARIIADSVSANTNVRIVTYELEYPRFIHSEFMTHRMLSKNAASSRAIPVEKQIENILANTAMPIHWGKNQPGMSAKEECNEPISWWQAPNEETPKGTTREEAWNKARNNAIYMARCFHKAGYHKQIVNRLLEPFTFIKVVATGTEFANLFHLRCHPDAQPEFQELARCMKEAYDQHPSIELEPGEWHVPYFANGHWSPHMTGENCYGDRGVSLEDALMVSASCCAQVSYRKNDDSLEKAKDIYKRLVESKPMHASPFEHQATPIEFMLDHNPASILDKGITHINWDKKGFLQQWSGNFRGWIQHRQLVDGHVVW